MIGPSKLGTIVTLSWQHLRYKLHQTFSAVYHDNIEHIMYWHPAHSFLVINISKDAAEFLIDIVPFSEMSHVLIEQPDSKDKMLV